MDGQGAWPRGLGARLDALERCGARLELRLPDRSRFRIGPGRALCRVDVADRAALVALARGDHLAAAEAFLARRIDVEGDLREALRVLDTMQWRATPWARLARAVRGLAARSRWRRASVAFHYDRPPDFFLPWLDRWRSYTHGLYASPGEDLETAQERKLARAFEALGLAPGARVLDVGCGWGSFMEYAGRRGVAVQGLTLSAAQHAFVVDRLAREGWPGRVSCADFFDWEPERPLDGAVLMGSLEHLVDLDRVAARLARWLAPGARIWADFCSAPGDDTAVGAFLARHIWPGHARYVRLPRLRRALARHGFRELEVADDTASYALTVRHWAERLDRESKALEERFGADDVRAFRLFLRASQAFFETRRTQAHHLVATRLSASSAGG
jgi:cyclopropane-fatty-acyl-phospholipid synthase